MKKLLLASAVALIPTVAMAADLQAQTAPAAKTAPCPSTSTTLCNGWYVGVEVGGTGTNSNLTVGNAAMMGANVGFKYWSGTWMIGTDISADYDGTVGSPTFLSMQTLRFGGYLAGLFTGTPAPAQGPLPAGVGAIVPYALAGMAEKQVVGSQFATGWVTGAGVEGPLGGRWSWKAEYDYIGFQTHDISSEQIVRVGFEYHL